MSSQSTSDVSLARSAPCWAALIGCIALGCTPQPPLGKAVGRVTFQGKPVAAGAVIFSNEGEGAAYVSHIRPDGSFQFEVAAGYGLPPGEYAVAIGPPQPKPSLEMELSPPPRGEFPPIPRRYSDPTTSGIMAIVKEGENAPFLYDIP